ncbi:MAG: hypothetical protein ACFFEM_10895, partial [Candidatus Thorarchaeota archaeon]
MKSRQTAELGRVIAIIAVLLIGFSLISSLVPVLFPTPSGTPPVNPPPIGYLDNYEHQDERTIEATDQLVSIDNTYFYHTFATNGEAVCLYGNFTSNLPVHILITDYDGYDEYTSTGDTDKWKYRKTGVDQDEWDFVTDPFLDGDYVDQWYVIISAFGYFVMEFDRHVSYYFCQDLTAPYLSATVPEFVSGITEINFRAQDLHCPISRVSVFVNGSEIYQSTPNVMSFSTSAIWNTWTFDNGTYMVEIYIRDSVGNSYTYLWWSFVNNTSPETMQQEQLEATAIYIGIGSGFSAPIITILPRLRKIKGSKYAIVVLAIVSV